MKDWLGELPEVDMTLPQPVEVRAVQFGTSAETEKFAHRTMLQALQKAYLANSDMSHAVAEIPTTEANAGAAAIAEGIPPEAEVTVDIHDTKANDRNGIPPSNDVGPN